MESVFYFEVTYYEDGEHIEGGFIYADSFSNAMKKVEDYYGDTIVSIDKIYGYDSELLSVPMSISRRWKKEFDKVF